MKCHYIFITAIVLICMSKIGFCTDDSLRFELSLEGMYFLHDSDVPGQDNHSVSFTFQPKYKRKWGFGKKNLDIHLFARADANDSERSHVDIRELSWAHAIDNYEYKIGVSKEFWGVVESYRLVDIINQKDPVEELDYESRMGHPMVKMSYFSDWGEFSGWILPYFRERVFASNKSRAFSGPVNVDADRASYYSSKKEHHVDFAVRYANSFEDVDFGLSYFQGTQRDPVLEYDSTNNTLTPYYDQVKQMAADAQWTGDALLLKLEALYRDEKSFGSSHAAIYGFEYTFFNIYKGHDLGAITELLYDSRGKNRTSFDNDIFLGIRYTLNDTDATEILIGGFIDLNDGSKSFRAKLEKRINNDWKYELIFQSFQKVSDNDLFFSGIDNDDFLRMNLRYYF